MNWLTQSVPNTPTKSPTNCARKIEAEIKKLGDHQWAGDYYEGDGLGENVTLVIAPESGYLFEWHGCLGLYDRNYGAVTWDKGNIRLSFTFKNERKGFEGIAEQFTPIAWGDRKYLVPSDDIVGFCNEVNQGNEPRQGVHGRYLLREGDEKKEATGLPAIPPEFNPYVLPHSIQAEIAAVGNPTTRPSVCDWRFKDTPVTLNAGKKAGLLSGMELYVVEPKNLVQSVKITEVEEEKSQAVMTQTGEEKAGPQIGWRLSTRLPWHSEP